MKLFGFTPKDALEHIETTMTVTEFEQFCRLHTTPIGTIWCTALHISDKNKLQGTRWDPYGSIRWQHILVALQFLHHPDTDEDELEKWLGNPLLTNQ